jgi:quercetin dioxygenase-like cupin family protein
MAESHNGTAVHARWDDIELEQLNPQIARHFVVGEQVMLARILLKKGAVVPRHSHVNEQITWVQAGALQFELDGRTVVVRAGEVLCIPPNLPHEALALEDTVDIDVFTPPRADWINKSDAYLRGGK